MVVNKLASVGFAQLIEPIGLLKLRFEVSRCDFNRPGMDDLGHN